VANRLPLRSLATTPSAPLDEVDPHRVPEGHHIARHVKRFVSKSWPLEPKLNNGRIVDVSNDALFRS